MPSVSSSTATILLHCPARAQTCGPLPGLLMCLLSSARAGLWRRFLGGGAYELRYQVAIVAPEEVVEASTIAFRELRLLRERLREGALRTDAAVAEARRRWKEAFGKLRTRIRADLGASGR
ncbi:hypothetical protein ACTWQF_18325 [Streptomyces sp. 8N114]|uniref:hypothetical protein n=1 Tax=Streptomyces sp. 8N114 TaxID=3457419 RepID=UPI003FD36CCB